MLVRSLNPATLKTNVKFKTISSAAALRQAQKCREAFEYWRTLDVNERATRIRRLATVLRNKKEDYARTMTIEMGKPIKQALAEVEKCAWTAEVYADNAARWLRDERVEADGKRHSVTFEPLGVILGIMPWNFPFWQVFRFAIPALTAGNACMLRHSNVVPMCSLAIEDAFRQAGFADHIFKSVITDHDTVEELIASQHIAGVSLTGSVAAGARVGALAGANIKPFVLELGGSDPFIVLEDANVTLACKNAMTGRTINSGQSCIAAKRFIVVRDVADEFTEKLVRYTENLNVGNPMDESTDVGPLANAEQLEKLDKQVKDAVRKGARVLTGGRRAGLLKPFNKGYFYKPTVLANVKPNMLVLREEVFGPVSPIIVVKDEEEAIRVANESEFGLGASVWTRDAEHGEEVARRLQAGCVFVNSIVKSDPRMPFGGVKRSGVGRELSHYGLKSFVNIKGVNVYEA
ncbi:MAG: NAD-dependent succinate-semialdehyde dehydrogenase [Candidatus Aenigmatarchaeota archaeon]|nr:MAG: NAD-dependent succinate-semialdehyde dehydrogenase [Candidatus Aenigmarchaeota archaeon]